MKFFGAHVSIAGGVENAPLNAAAIGGDAFALFTKNQRQWQVPPLEPESVAKFRSECQRLGFAAAAILPHDGYLINLCQPDPEKLKLCRASFTAELERCRALGLDKLNFHPGSHLNALPRERAVQLVGESVRLAVDAVPGVTAVFEITSGQGSNLGSSFAELAALLEATQRPDRVGVCIDTCHAFAAGYDLATAEGFERTFAEFDRRIGFPYLKGMHLNDAKGALGSHLDRHASLGEGTLGWDCFARIAADPRFDGIPLILETVDPGKWPDEIAQLRKFASGSAG